MHTRTVLALVLALAGAGCKSYEPRPLDPEIELDRLARIDLAHVKVEHARPGEVGSATPALAFDPSDGVNEDEAVALALTLNPSIRAVRFGSVEARSRLVTAGLWPNPVFALTWEPGVSGAPGATASGAWLLEVVRIWERSTRIAAAEASARATEAQIVAAEWRLVAEVRSRLWAVLARERLLAILDEEVALRRRALELVRRGRELGEVRELDLALVELEVAETERDRRRLESELETARRELNHALGLPPGLAVPLSESGRPLTFTVYDDLDEAALDRRVLAGRFELRAKEQDYERAEHEHHLAIYRQYPPLGVGPSMQRQPEGTYYVGAAILLELPIFNQNQGEIAETDAARERMRFEYLSLLHDLKADAHEALGQLRRARLEVEAQERTVLPTVERSMKLLSDGLERRAISLLEWITAGRRALAARREYVATLTRYQEAVIRVETTTGVPLTRAR